MEQPRQNPIDQWLGLSLEPSELGFGHMALRSAVVFFSAVFMTRIADRRFLGQNAAFDVMLGIILGSVVSRAINGQTAFFPTLGAGFILVLLHKMLGAIACRWHPFSVLVKGRDHLLVRNGQVDERALRAADFSRDDLLENIRTQGSIASLDDVEEARLERNGRISVVPRRRPPG